MYNVRRTMYVMNLYTFSFELSFKALSLSVDEKSVSIYIYIYRYKCWWVKFSMNVGHYIRKCQTDGKQIWNMEYKVIELFVFDVCKLLSNVLEVCESTRGICGIRSM